MTASLDHALWFHRDFRVDDWAALRAGEPRGGGSAGLRPGHDLHARGSPRRLRRPGGPDAPGEPSSRTARFSAPAASARGAPAERAEADWDLSAYFASLGDAGYLGFRDALEADAAALEETLLTLGPLGDGNLAAWRAALAAPRGARGARRAPGLLLGCLSAADARDEDARREVARLARLRAALAKRYARARAALAAAPAATFARLLDEPALAASRHFLGRLREEAARRMPAELEELAADLEVTGLAAWSRLYDQLSGTLSFDLELPGEAPRRVPVSLVRSLLGDARAELRRAALAGANRAWASQADTLAACLNAIAGTRLELCRRRGVHFLEPALFDAGITRATLDAMLEAVAARRELPRRYLRRKAELLGRARLGFQDLEAPLPFADAERVSFDAARERILAASAATTPRSARSPRGPSRALDRLVAPPRQAPRRLLHQLALDLRVAHLPQLRGRRG